MQLSQRGKRCTHSPEGLSPCRALLSHGTWRLLPAPAFSALPQQHNTPASFLIRSLLCPMGPARARQSVGRQAFQVGQHCQNTAPRAPRMSPRVSRPSSQGENRCCGRRSPQGEESLILSWGCPGSWQRHGQHRSTLTFWLEGSLIGWLLLATAVTLRLHVLRET